MLTTASEQTYDLPSVEESVYRGSSSLSAREREFARYYVLHGGNATKAAAMAGYGESGAHVAGHRCLTRSRVLAEIKRLMLVNIHAYLPIAIRVLIDIACDPEQDARARVQAANSLLDRGGMSAPKGGVNVSVGIQVNNNEVQTLIGSIWDAKSRRMSDIAGGMSDTNGAIEHMPMDDPDPSSAALGAVDDGGGDASSGTPRSVSNIPPPSPSPCPKSAGAFSSGPIGGSSGAAAEEMDDGRDDDEQA